MKILYDARKITQDATGVGYVAEKLLEQLVFHQDLEIIAFTKKGIKQLPKFSKYKNLVIHETSDDSHFFGIKRVLFEQLSLPKILNHYQPDILHLTNGFGMPLIMDNKQTKTVLTIHDLIPLTGYHELMNPFEEFIFKTLLNNCIRRADDIVSVSDFTSKDLSKYFPEIKNISVAYNGVDPLAKNINDEITWKKVKTKYQFSDDFICYIGGFAPRKNVLNLVKGFSRFIKTNGSKIQLILCGKFSNNKDVSENIETVNRFINEQKLNNQVRMIGYLKYDEKMTLLARAKFFTYISLYEGFGLPVLEAFSAGTPVLTSKDSAMEEVAGKYALYCNPNDIKSITEKISEMLTNYLLYKKLAEEAKIKLIPQFNWQKTGNFYYNLYLK